MRFGLMIAWVLLCCAPCYAQDSGRGSRLPLVQSPRTGRCSPMVNTPRGRVSTVDDRTLKGRVQCLDGENLAIETTSYDAPGRVTRRLIIEPMSNVKQVAQLKDGIADGVVKGAAFGLIVLIPMGGGDQCLNRTALTCTLQAVATGAFIGGLIDATHGRQLVLYPTPSRGRMICWRIRF